MEVSQAEYLRAKRDPAALQTAADCDLAEQEALWRAVYATLLGHRCVSCQGPVFVGSLLGPPVVVYRANGAVDYRGHERCLKGYLVADAVEGYWPKDAHGRPVPEPERATRLLQQIEAHRLTEGRLR